jgi:aryl-alcohol dehydrogenase-like predicted oxidoreductase
MTDGTLTKNFTQLFQPLTQDSYFPQLWLGTWSMGGENFGPFSLKDAEKTLSKAYSLGLRHVDTAAFYAHGQSDRILSKFLNTIDRKTLFISSKAGLKWNKNTVQHCGDKKSIISTLHQSLDTLNTDYIDLFSLHWPDSNVKLQESIETLKDLKTEGLIRNYGMCNLSEHELNELIDKKTPHQLRFNPLHKDVIPILSAVSPIIAYSPFEQGLLSSGKCGHGPLFLGKKDFRLRNPFFKNKDALIWRDILNDLALKHFLPKEVIVLLWIYSFPEIDSIISGARTEDQLSLTFSIFEWCTLFKLNWDDRLTWKQKLSIIFGKDLFNHLYGLSSSKTI